MEDFQATHSGTEERQHYTNIDISRLVSIDEGRTFTTSLVLAQVFERNHKDVLRAIDNLECSDEFRGRNFAPTFNEISGPNGAVRSERAFHLTRDGFSFLAMGFTGSKAAAWKEKFLEAFNAMEKALLTEKQTLLEYETQPTVRISLSNDDIFKSNRNITEQQADVIKGMICLVAYVERTSMDFISNQLLFAMQIQRVEDIRIYKFYNAFVFLWSKIFNIGCNHNINDDAQNIPNHHDAINGFIECWVYISNNYTRHEITNYICNVCNIDSLDTITTEVAANKAILTICRGIIGRTFRSWSNTK